MIYYHDVHDNVKYTAMSTPMTLFEQHLQTLSKHFKTVNKITEGNNQLIICFDDGFKGIYENKDIFIEKDVYVRIFIITNFIGEENYLSSEEIIELNKYPNFTFGSHTHNHLNLGEIKDDAAIFEILNSKNQLEKLLGEKIEHLCFPRGSFNNNTVQLAKDAGYKYLYSSIPGNYFSHNNQEVIYRNLVQHETKFGFKLSIHGAQNILRKKRFKQHFKDLNNL